jgi:hypothetical protein
MTIHFITFVKKKHPTKNEPILTNTLYTLYTLYND